METSADTSNGINQKAMADIERSIKELEGRLNNNRYRLPPDALLEHLATSHYELYRMGRKESLDDAIENMQEALNASGDGYFYKRRQSLLVQYLLERGQKYDIEEAIDISSEYTQNDGSANHWWLWHLADGLVRQYTWTGNMTQLNHAIQAARNSVPTEYEGQDTHAPRWMTLAHCLRERFLRTKNIRNVDEAIRIVEKLVDNPPQKDPDMRNYLHNLAILHLERYEETEIPADLDKGIATAKKALDSTSPCYYAWETASCLNTLAIALATRSKLTKNIDDLNQAAEAANKAVDATPKSYPERDHFLDTLATCLSDRYDQTMSEDDRAKSIEYSKITFRSSNITPVRRVVAARQAIRLYVAKCQYGEASDLAEDTLRLLPMVCSRYLSQADQQYAAMQTSGLAAEACSLILAANGDPNRALEYLEHGRGLIIGYLIDNRRDIAELRKKKPRLADRYGKTRAKTMMASRHKEPSGMPFEIMQDIEETEASLEGCLRDIRKVEGFERFLCPPLATELIPYSKEGPIVFVNVTHISSDALIVRPSGITPLNLPNFHAVKVQKYRAWGLTKDTRSIAPDKESQSDKRYCRFLASLWSDCVRLVLDKLGVLSNPSTGAELPRVWWIGTGMASSLPFHAAGLHSKDDRYRMENAYTYIISSYTPSIKALGYAREKATNPKATAQQPLLLVTMRKTPDMTDLPGVDNEKEQITAALKSQNQNSDQDQEPRTDSVKLMPHPHAKAVLTALRSHNIVHFACHGCSDLSDPSNSYLALQGSKSATTLDRLTVRQVSESRLRRSWLAYLSACSTAQNKVDDLADEALHLASGFQVAGFAHVIAAMWPSDDAVCAQVAGIFYSELLTKLGVIKEGNRAAAVALHAATIIKLAVDIKALLSLKPSTFTCRAVEDDAEANVTATDTEPRNLQRFSERRRALIGFVREAPKLKCFATEELGFRFCYLIFGCPALDQDLEYSNGKLSDHKTGHDFRAIMGEEREFGCTISSTQRQSTRGAGLRLQYLAGGLDRIKTISFERMKSNSVLDDVSNLGKDLSHIIMSLLHGRASRVYSKATTFVVGGHIGPQTKNSLKKQVQQIVDGPNGEWILETLAGLPRYWEAMTEKLPEVSSTMQGDRLLADLASWFRHGPASVESLAPDAEIPDLWIGVLMVAIQLDQYWRYLEFRLNNPTGTTVQDMQAELVKQQQGENNKVETVGFCAGMIAAVTVASSSNRQEFEKYGGTALRIGALMAALVGATEARSKGLGKGGSISLATAWRTRKQCEDMGRIVSKLRTNH
ncbi:TPR domain protein [Fusarium tjaetaba]|uniref:TPR domain protein n=1 Tax=Fusarium tjaetaba TaxID=1567544 RepID=A0A8H5VIT9_9HYPO|nr:TPR domain protein [Fusarium tjaetaba]KAF5626372.1 TPR domain protein [Fusarium tjaetaba]